MNNPQSQLLLLRYSIISKYMFLTRCVPPDVSEAALTTLSSHVSQALSNIMGIDSISARVYNTAIMPLSVGGLGLTDLKAIRHTAYFASASHALQTWSHHFGANHPIIVNWTAKASRCSVLLDRCLQIQHDNITAFNTTKIAVQPKFAPNNPNMEKADPECLLPAVTVPVLPQSLAAICKSTVNANSKLQRDLSHIHAALQFRKLWRSTTQHDGDLRTQILANTAKSTNLWLRVTPDNPKFRFTTPEFRLNILQHFALDEQINNLLGLNITTAHTSKSNTQTCIPCTCTDNNFSVDDDDSNPAHPRRPARPATYTHLVNCRNKMAFQYRHNRIVDVCADATKSVSLQPELELQVSTSPAITGNNNQKLERKRFDVTVGDIAPGLKTLQLDISVASHRRTEDQFRVGCSRYPLYAADRKVIDKLSKYQLNFFPDTEVVVPLVCETSGAVHPNFQKFFASLALRVDNQPPAAATWTTPTFITYWMAVVSCTLRRESAKSLFRLARAALQAAGCPGADDRLPSLVPQSRGPSHL